MHKFSINYNLHSSIFARHFNSLSTALFLSFRLQIIDLCWSDIVDDFRTVACVSSLLGTLNRSSQDGDVCVLGTLVLRINTIHVITF